MARKQIKRPLFKRPHCLHSIQSFLLFSCAHYIILYFFFLLNFQTVIIIGDSLLKILQFLDFTRDATCCLHENIQKQHQIDSLYISYLIQLTTY